MSKLVQILVIYKSESHIQIITLQTQLFAFNLYIHAYARP